MVARGQRRAALSIAAVIAAGLAAGIVQARRAEQAGSLLGSGHGLDHVMVVVRDLDAAARTYANALGFNVIPGGTFPGGMRNSAVVFGESYIELMSVDASKAPPGHELSQLLQKREGGYAFALNVSSAQQTADFLRARQFEVAGPSGSAFTPQGSQELKTSLWQTVAITRPELPYQPMFFIEYAARKSRTAPEHRNTAAGIHAVWVAVSDLDAATRAYEAVGLRAGETVRMPQLAAEGREIAAGLGAIVLLRSKDTTGPIAPYIQRNGEGVIGLSIEVRDLEAARSLVRASTREALEPYTGSSGKAVLIRPEFTHGVWLELVQSASTARAESSEPTEAVLERLDREGTDAEVRGDADAVGRLLTDDFVSVSPAGGVSNKDQFLADYRSGDVHVESEQNEDYVIRLHGGDVAVMVHAASLKGTYRGARIDGRIRSLHVWRKTPEGWLIAASQGTPIR